MKILERVKKVPAGVMVVPMVIGSLINTFIPEVVRIGSFTTATFTSVGAATAIGIQLFALGTMLQLRDMPKVLKRGGLLLFSKFLIGAIIGIAVGKMFGKEGLMGLTTLAIISSVTNSNGSVFLALMSEYGDETDCASMALLTINDGPFLTLVAMGASGLANIPLVALIAAVGPLVIGMILGNLDKDIQKFLAPAGTILIPFVGFCLGAGIKITNLAKGGIGGILLGLICCFVGGAFILLCDRLIGGRPGYAAWGVATTAGNAVAVPAAVALVDPAWAAYEPIATAQVAAAAVLTALIVPFITSWWAKKYGCPKFPLPGQDFSKESVI
ncbi:2-keto-3-deoxygluconate permease [bioreactor metagenome]|uniref:2-keto-3-deoxygluconate permease n=1 Tax=bioreactor metagenome TaxID=1076179 RepID=A0A644VC09_9ZZZZ|nr:2-keto-3-deoxygluconate permease [Acidaminococcaceae bacterium]NLU45176.1 2-keto-3-deoxygluconate permease [Acholeplasmataceae bacterium]